VVVLVRVSEGGRDREGPLPPCGSGLDREGRRHEVQYVNAALSWAWNPGCSSHGASLFLVWPRKSNQKEGHPYIRVLLRKTSLAPALLRGSSRRAIPGPSLLARHPCLASPCAAPTLGLLKGIRDRVVCKFIDSGRPLRSFTSQKSARRCRTPLSGGRMESAWRGVSGMDAARGLGVPAIKGHGWPLYAGRWNVDGMREVERSETRMQGQDFLVPFGGPAIRATAKRDSPSRAKPAPHTGTTSGSHLQSRKPTSLAVKTAPTSLTSDATTRSTYHASGTPRRPHTMSLSPCA